MAAMTGVPAGYALWSVTEYLTHRWVMHGRRRRNPLAAEHRRHHADPEATDPLLRTAGHAAMAVVSVALARAVSPATGAALARGIGAGFLAGYSSYEILHWRSHHRTPGNSFEERLRRRHFAHHDRAAVNFGVTSSVWDQAMATAAGDSRARVGSSR